MAIMGIRNNRIVIELRNANKEQIAQFLKTYLGASGKGINRLFAQGNVSINRVDLTLYR